MIDPRVDRMAELLVNFSTRIGRGDRVLVEGEPAAGPLIESLFKHILRSGGHPFLLLSLSGIDTYSGLDDVFMRYADEAQIDFAPTLHLHAYENFESRIRIYSSSNTKALSGVDRAKLSRRRKAVQGVLQTQFSRGASGEFRWMTTLFPDSRSGAGCRHEPRGIRRLRLPRLPCGRRRRPGRLLESRPEGTRTHRGRLERA